MNLNARKTVPNNAKRSTLPLAEIRVADFSWLAAGPLATRFLATMGAEVVRVESRKRVDQLRQIGPYPDGIHGINRSPHFNLLNYSKLSMTLDLSTPRGADMARRLVMVSDVVVENFAAGVLERLGLGWEDVRRSRPDIVYLSSSGLGRAGPAKHYVAYGMTLHAFSGVTHATGYAGQPPRPLSGTWADPVTAVTMAYAILAALHHRRRTGQGQYIDLAMSDAMLAITPEQVIKCSLTGRVPERSGNFEEIAVPHNTYRCRGDDSWVAIAVRDEAEWHVFCRATGHREWAADSRFADAYARRCNEAEMDRAITAWTREHTARDVTERLQKVGVAAFPCLTAMDVIQDPQLRARDFFVTVNHPEVGERPVLGHPWRMSSMKTPNYEPAPLLGQHSAYVLRDVLGLPTDEAQRLVDEKVVY
ncbi:MAG: CoA transferase [Dehalococcoidia bacterium]|nr:CoA transferase [Dehalococcoidia bacterium]